MRLWHFKKGAEVIGKKIGVAGDEPTCEQMAASLSQALGQPVRYNEISPEVFRSFGFPGAEDLGNMFQFYRDFDEVCTATRNVAYSRTLNPELQSFDQWLAANKDRLPIE
jgi:hypothetical protein